MKMPGHPSNTEQQWEDPNYEQEFDHQGSAMTFMTAAMNQLEQAYLEECELSMTALSPEHSL